MVKVLVFFGESFGQFGSGYFYWALWPWIPMLKVM